MDKRQNYYRIVGRCFNLKLRVTRYPNHETRLALYPERLPKDIFREASKSQEQSHQSQDETVDSGVVIESDSIPIRDEIALDIKSKVDTPLKPRRLAMSRYGRNQLMRAGSCFDMAEGTERLLLTGTLPGRQSKAFRALSEYSTYASKTLTNWITRRHPGCKWEYAWEFQRRGALHIHLVVEIPLHVSEYIKEHFKDEWNRILRKICNLSGVDLFARTENYSHKEEKTQADVTVCDKNPSRYISKYISKSSTSAKGFNCFPPKTWYQISRSLLCKLREATLTYEVEGLSYRQALCFIEEANYNLSRYEKKGSRRFNGSVLAWSGYYYDSHFNPHNWHEKIMKQNHSLISVKALADLARSTMKHYPGGSCYIRAATHPRTFDLMEKGMLSETELLMYVESVITTLDLTYSTLWNKSRAGHFLLLVENWWSAKYGYPKVDPKTLEDIVKNRHNYLTDDDVRTKVQVGNEKGTSHDTVRRADIPDPLPLFNQRL